MTNAIYAPRLEYVSDSESPEKELTYAIDSICTEESIAKCFGYLFNNYDKYKIVFIINGTIFEMDVIIKEKNVSVIKGSFNDIKMYLIAKVAKKLNIPLPENGFQYIERRIISILTGGYSNDYINVKEEINLMENTIKTIRRNGYLLFVII